MTKIENSKNFTLLSTEYTAFVCTLYLYRVCELRTQNAVAMVRIYEKMQNAGGLYAQYGTLAHRNKKQHLLIAAKVCVTARHRDC